MERRVFVKRLWTVSLVGFVAARVEALAADADHCELEDGVLGHKSFGYYEGLLPNGTRSPSRSDGTYYEMPCILQADVDAGEEKEYEFWHGHGGGKHRFVVTVENFATLRDGDPIEIYTDVIDGHRHALRISPAEACATRP